MLKKYMTSYGPKKMCMGLSRTSVVRSSDWRGSNCLAFLTWIIKIRILIIPKKYPLGGTALSGNSKYTLSFEIPKTFGKFK